MWNFSRHGAYTVKSGYYQIMNNIMNHTQAHQKDGNWAKLWHISTPPKIRSFLWRAARDYLPCRIKLQSRNIQVPSQCVTCESGLENNWHIFIDCPYAKECWKVAKFEELVSQCAREEDSFPKWLFKSLNKCPTTGQPNFSAVLWSLWRYRNEKLWNGVSRPPHITVSLGFDMVLRWNQAQRKSIQGQNSISRRNENVRWTKPPEPSMKCNVDTALFKEQRAVGFGTVVRDSMGNFMVSKTCVTCGLFDVKEAEALALLDAFKWTSSLELQDVIFETDSETVVKTIRSKNVDYTEFGSIIFGCGVQSNSRSSPFFQNPTC
ncbi:uncharacterized protein [Primulina huaijiensis]|uniref:uncharacterized protein n=1 Tax=Primulina huaijiensis TaxID=1492673 RepID=UPI003CC730AB